MINWGEDEDTARLRTPVDPWPVVEPEPVARPRRVYGYVYELVTGDQRDGAHPYAGQTTTTIHRRVHGPGRAHLAGERRQGPVEGAHPARPGGLPLPEADLRDQRPGLGSGPARHGRGLRDR